MSNCRRRLNVIHVRLPAAAAATETTPLGRRRQGCLGPLTRILRHARSGCDARTNERTSERRRHRQHTERRRNRRRGPFVRSFVVRTSLPFQGSSLLLLLLRGPSLETLLLGKRRGEEGEIFLPPKVSYPKSVHPFVLTDTYAR